MRLLHLEVVYVELDDVEKKILVQLCTEGKYVSSVDLAADLYDTSEEWRALEWTLVESVLSDLNEKGLVTYRLGRFDVGGPHAGLLEGEVFVHLRPTPKAYEVLKLAFQWMRVAGSAAPHNRRYEAAVKHEADRTDFRTHRSAQAEGGSIEKDFIVDHIEKYAEHAEAHRATLREMFGVDTID